MDARDAVADRDHRADFLDGDGLLVILDLLAQNFCNFVRFDSRHPVLLSFLFRFELLAQPRPIVRAPNRRKLSNPRAPRRRPAALVFAEPRFNLFSRALLKRRCSYSSPRRSAVAPNVTSASAMPSRAFNSCRNAGMNFMKQISPPVIDHHVNEVADSFVQAHLGEICSITRASLRFQPPGFRARCADRGLKIEIDKRGQIFANSIAVASARTQRPLAPPRTAPHRALN